MLDKIYEKMSLYYDGELTGDELTAFETNLFEDPEFAQEYIKYAQLLEEVVSTPLIEPPTNLREKIMKRVHEEARPIELFGEKNASNVSIKRKRFSLFPTATIRSLLMNENTNPRTFRRFASAAAAVVVCVVALGTALNMLETGQPMQFATAPSPPAAPAQAAGDVDALWSEMYGNFDLEQIEVLGAVAEPQMAARLTDGADVPFGTPIPTHQDLLPEDLVIRSASISLEVEDFDFAMRTVNSLAGHNEDVNISGGGYRNPFNNASVTRRVPIERYNESLDVLRNIGRVTSEREFTDNAGTTIANAQVRTSALNHEIARLFTYLEYSETVSDLTLISARIGVIEQEVLDAQRQVHNLTHSIAQPRIHISVTEVETIEEVQPTSFFEDVSAGFLSSLDFISRTFTGFVVLIARIGLPALIIAILAFVFIRVYRGFTKPATLPKEGNADEA